MTKEYPETHQQGIVEINELFKPIKNNIDVVDFGVQISSDGRVWICIDGQAFIRFKPKRSSSSKTKLTP